MKFKNIKYFFIIFVIIIIAFAIYIVNSQNNVKENKEIQVANEVVYQNHLDLGISDFDTINPLLTKNKEMININQLIYEPLLIISPEYELNTCLANEYAKTSATTYIIKINTDIKWSNGENLSAKDIKYTIDLLKSVNNIYSENVKNIESVETIDNATVKINLSDETYFFEYNLIFPIMCQSNYENEDFFKSKKHPIGTGKYKIASISESKIKLEKNENYRNQEQINKNIENININIYKGIGEVYNAFKIGNIDIINTSSITYENYIGTMGYYIKEYKGREYDFLSCNCNDNLMKQKSVRQAISFAIDKENIVSSVYNNKYYISEYVLDFNSFLYSESSPSAGYNPEKSKQILENDGWVYSNNRWKKDGYNLNITIGVNASNVKRCETAQIIKNQLENIGIQVNVIELSDGQYNWNLNNKNYQVLLTGVYNRI